MRIALKARQRLVDDHPDVPRYQATLAMTHNNVGLMHYKSAEIEDAVAECRNASAIQGCLVRDHPDVPEYQIALTATRCNLGLLYADLGQHGEAVHVYTSAVDVSQHWYSAMPNSSDVRMQLTRALQGLAWLQATSKENSIRNGISAVKLATQACELTGWKDSMHLGTLAAAYAESGNFEEAVKTQTKAIELAKDAQKREMQSRLENYKAKQPYREPIAPASS